MRGGGHVAWLVSALLLAGAPRQATAGDGGEEHPAGGPSIGFTLLAGVALPTCTGQPAGCAGLGPAPSVQGLVLFQPNRAVAMGVVGQLSRLRWRGSYVGQIDGQTSGVESDLTNVFAGLAVRFAFLPEHVVTPVLQLAAGFALQEQTGSNFNCNGGPIPASQLGVGASARLAPSVSLFALASASIGFTDFCEVIDGPPATPFAGWGYAFHAGASFDVALERNARTSRLAAAR
jgi:hypothetical protein